MDKNKNKESTPQLDIYIARPPKWILFNLVHLHLCCCSSLVYLLPQRKKLIFWYTQARSPYAILRARGKKKQKFGEPSLSRSRPRERIREAKTELAGKKTERLVKIPLSTRLCSCAAHARLCNNAEALYRFELLVSILAREKASTQQRVRLSWVAVRFIRLLARRTEESH
jgi:hypothetical protein